MAEIPSFRAPFGAPPPDKPRPSGAEWWAAVAQENNILAAAWARIAHGKNFDIDPSYSVLDDPVYKNSKWRAQEPDYFIGSRSQAETLHLIDELERRERRGQILAEAGLPGLAAGAAVGAFDPSMFIPGRTIVRVAGRTSIPRSIGAAAASGVVQGVAQQAVIDQINKTPFDADAYLTNIGVSAMLAGILGGGASALLRYGERVRAENALRDIRGEARQPVPEGEEVAPPPRPVEPAPVEPVAPVEAAPVEPARPVEPVQPVAETPPVTPAEPAPVAPETPPLSPEAPPAEVRAPEAPPPERPAVGRTTEEIAADLRRQVKEMQDEAAKTVSPVFEAEVVDIAALATRAERDRAALRIEEKQFPRLIDALREAFGISEEIGFRITAASQSVGELKGTINRRTGEVSDIAIWLNPNWRADGTPRVGVLLHEFGHAVQHTLLAKAPDDVKLAIENAHKAFLKETEGLTDVQLIERQFMPDALQAVAAKVEQIDGGGPGFKAEDIRNFAEYQRKFEEWFANEVAKFISKEVLPKTLAEKFFAKLADAWKRFYAAITGRLPVDEEVAKFLRSKLLTGERQQVVDGPERVPSALEPFTDRLTPEEAGDTSRNLQMVRFGQWKQTDTLIGKYLAVVTDKMFNGLMRLSPTMRTFSQNALVMPKRVLAELAETALAFHDNERGITTTFGGRPAVSREVTVLQNALRLGMSQILADEYKNIRPSGKGPLADFRSQMMSTIDAVRDVEGRPMSFSEFSGFVADALNSGDEHVNPNVEKAATRIRELIRPIVDRARAAGYDHLDVDFAPPGAKSWFMRVWDVDKIKTGEYGNLRSRISSWLKSEEEHNRAVREKIKPIYDDLRDQMKLLGSTSEKLQRVEQRIKNIEARRKERGMEYKEVVERKIDTEAERTNVLAELSDTQDFINDLRDALKPDSPTRLELDEMRDVLKELRDEVESYRPGGPSKNDEARLTFIDDRDRRIAEMAAGRVAISKDWEIAGRVTAWFREGGGIRPGSVGYREFVSALGGEAAAKKRRLVAKEGEGVTLEGIVEDINGVREGQRRITHDDVIRAIENQEKGQLVPGWWVQYREAMGGGDVTEKLREAYEARALAEEMDQQFGMPAFTPTDVLRARRGDFDVGRRGPDPADIIRDASDPASPPASYIDEIAYQRNTEFAADSQAMAIAAKEKVLKDFQRDLDKARRRKAVLEKLGYGAYRAEREASSSATRNFDRLGALLDMEQQAKTKRDLLEMVQRNAERERDAAWKKLETELAEWRGNSAKDAILEIKKRAAQLSKEPELVVNQRKIDRLEKKVKDGKTLTQEEADYLADPPLEYDRKTSPLERSKAVNDEIKLAVKRIFEDDLNKPPEWFDNRADEIIQRIIGSPNGRLPYEEASSQEGKFIGANTQAIPRGSLHKRDFAIPYELVKDFLVRDTERIGSAFARTFIPDVLLTERFGDPDMTAAFRAIQEDFRDQMKDKTPAEQAKLVKVREQVMTDISAIRDRIRSVYGWSDNPTMQAMARFTALARSYSGVVDLGASTLSSMADAAGIMVHNGMANTIKNGWRPLMEDLRGVNPERKAAIAREMKAMMIGIDTDLNLRGGSMNEIIDATSATNKLERGAHWFADLFQVLNLQSPWTDKMKGAAAYVVVNNIIRAAKHVAEGTATASEISKLAASNINAPLAKRIWAEFKKEGGGENFDGIHIPNTGKWEADVASTFRGAVQREVDMAIVTPGQEKPLWMSHPVLGIFGSYRSFVAGATERVLVAGLQKGDAATFQGFAAMIGLGAVSYALSSLIAGRALSDDPRHWIKEGISKSGVLGWIDELNGIAAKASAGHIDMYAAIGANQPASRFQSRGVWSAVAGAAVGKVENALNIVGKTFAQDGGAAAIHSARQLIPMQNLFYLRWLFDAVESGAQSVFGVEPPLPKRA